VVEIQVCVVATGGNFCPSDNPMQKIYFDRKNKTVFQYIGDDIVYYLTPNVNWLSGDVDHYLSMFHNLEKYYASMPETFIISNIA
jgi:hypothetical protein